jgi:hypothetical protein
MGLTRSSFVRAIGFQSTTKFLPDSRWVLGSLLFIADKFEDLNLQELESREVIGSGIDRLPPARIRVGLVNEAQLGRRLDELRKTDLDPSGDKAYHTLAVPTAIIDPIHQSTLESDFEGDREVYMVGHEEEPPEKIVKGIQWEAEEEIARAACLARDAKKWKGHNGL